MKKRRFEREELRQPFDGDLARRFPPILTMPQVSQLLGYSTSTIYEWVSRGKLDGCSRKRGKQLRFWRERLLDLFFNGPDWNQKESVEIVESDRNQ